MADNYYVPDINDNAVALASYDNGTAHAGRVTLGPATTGGLSINRQLDLGTTGQVVKNAAGQVYGAVLHNAHGTNILFVKFYNKATAASSGDTPVITIPIPAKTTLSLSFENGIAFGTGIGIRATTTVADNGNVAPGTNEIVTNVFYK